MLQFDVTVWNHKIVFRMLQDSTTPSPGPVRSANKAVTVSHTVLDQPPPVGTDLASVLVPCQTPHDVYASARALSYASISSWWQPCTPLPCIGSLPCRQIHNTTNTSQDEALRPITISTSTDFLVLMLAAKHAANNQRASKHVQPHTPCTQSTLLCM